MRRNWDLSKGLIIAILTVDAALYGCGPTDSTPGADAGTSSGVGGSGGRTGSGGSGGSTPGETGGAAGDASSSAGSPNDGGDAGPDGDGASTEDARTESNEAAGDTGVTPESGPPTVRLVAYTGSGAHRGNGANNGSLNIGREFTVTATSVRVHDLGIWDEHSDGLAAAHTVTLFSLSKVGSGAIATPITGGSVTVPAGEVATLESGFRFAPLANPIDLVTGSYAVVAYGMDANDPYGDGGNISSSKTGIAHAGFDPYEFTAAASPNFKRGRRQQPQQRVVPLRRHGPDRSAIADHAAR